jgi:glucose/arabinose dehydrogenase
MAFTPFIRAALFSAALFASALPTAAQANTNTATTNTIIERVGPTLSHPWGMEFLDHDTVLVTERDGRLLRIDLADGKATQITGVPRVYARRQGGLLDVAAIDGHVYLCYAALLDGGSATAIDRAVLDGNRLVKRQTIFTGNETSRSGHHFGCRMQLTGGMIYASLGDRGERANGQNPATNAASIIRINLDGSVPADNPLLPGWAPENFTIGHRNPQGMAMHPRTGAIWTHEHGPRGGDEINIIRPAEDEGAQIEASDGGGNYGWPAVSHGREYATGRRVSQHDSLPGYVDPVWVWDPSIAPSGMAFYPNADDGNDTGRMFPEFGGHLLVGSLKFRRLYLVELGEDGLPASERVIIDGQIGRIRDVAVAPHGPFAGAILLLSDEAQGGLYIMRR